MTHEEIDKMEAGEEMNALITEKVMGWRVMFMDRRYDDDGWSQRGPFSSPGMCANKAIAYYEESNGVCLVEVEDFSPSTDIAAAWQVAEKTDLFKEHKLKKESKEFVIYRDEWSSFCDEPAELDCVVLSKSESFPVVICRAALKHYLTV